MRKIYLGVGIIFVLFLSLYFMGIFRDNFYTSREIANIGGKSIYSSNYFEDSYIIMVEKLYQESISENFSVDLAPNLLKSTKYENCILKGYGFKTCKDIYGYSERSFVAVMFLQSKQDSGDFSKIESIIEGLFSMN